VAVLLREADPRERLAVAGGCAAGVHVDVSAKRHVGDAAGTVAEHGDRPEREV